MGLQRIGHDWATYVHEGVQHRGFLGQWDDTIMMGTCHYTFVKTCRVYNTKSKSSINYGLGVMMGCHCRLITCHTGTTLVGDVGHEAAMRVWGRAVYGKSLYLPLNFSVNLKLLYKIVFKKKLDYGYIGNCFCSLKKYLEMKCHNVCNFSLKILQKKMKQMWENVNNC